MSGHLCPIETNPGQDTGETRFLASALSPLFLALSSLILKSLCETHAFLGRPCKLDALGFTASLLLGQALSPASNCVFWGPEPNPSSLPTHVQAHMEGSYLSLAFY